ncbi:DUF3299 domain-containing protein [Donghicola eburneus]|uniref:DUF3299 domain-containing protein n=1 Tax=Donghicola eburneus TaxID=393278 RepID=UPI0008E02ABC|nr:DUF3299 domain-containing protein [Donghicola eburneus]SFQ57331.1 hypothetical protein SAMN05421764_106147 [Donghicola eburneus]
MLRTFMRALVLSLASTSALSAAPKQVTWDDLIAPGAPYSEIVGDGVIDFENDRWKPEFDENANQMNPALDGTDIRIPGYILPVEIDAEGVHGFILVPYAGACVHTPPPPPNQVVYVTTETPWRADSMWDVVWVEGAMAIKQQSTELAEIGYELTATQIEFFDE